MRNIEDITQDKRTNEQYHFPKEILEQPQAIINSVKNSEQVRKKLSKIACDIDRIITLGSGDCYFIGFSAGKAFEELSNIPTTNIEAYDFYISPPHITEKTLVIGFSSSGKSIYTVQSIKLAEKMGAITLGITNHKNSPLFVEPDYSIMTEAGISYTFPTKTTTSALAVLIALAADLGLARKVINENHYSNAMDEITHLVPQAITQIIENETPVMNNCADALSNAQHILFTGSGAARSCALIGAAKIIETSRRHTSSSNSEEYLHLIGFSVNESDCVIVLNNNDSNDREKLVAEYATKQKAKLIIFGNKSERELFPKSSCWIDTYSENLSACAQSIVSMVGLHLLASETNRLLNKNPDVPDNVDLKYVIDLLYSGPVTGWKFE